MWYRQNHQVSWCSFMDLLTFTRDTILLFRFYHLMQYGLNARSPFNILSTHLQAVFQMQGARCEPKPLQLFLPCALDLRCLCHDAWSQWVHVKDNLERSTWFAVLVARGEIASLLATTLMKDITDCSCWTGIYKMSNWKASLAMNIITLTILKVV